MEPDTYVITDDQWNKVNSALLAAISICSVYAPHIHSKMIEASLTMDEIVNGGDEEDPEDGFED